MYPERTRSILRKMLRRDYNKTKAKQNYNNYTEYPAHHNHQTQMAIDLKPRKTPSKPTTNRARENQNPKTYKN